MAIITSLRSQETQICASVEGQLNHILAFFAHKEVSSILHVVNISQFGVDAGVLAESELLIFNRSHILAIKADGLIASRAVAQIANMKWLALQGVFSSNCARSQHCSDETNGKGHKL